MRAVDYLLMGELDKNEIEEMKEKNILDLKEMSKNSIPDLIRRMIVKIDNTDEIRNVLYSACCNRINPDLAIKVVMEARGDKLQDLIIPPKCKKENKTAFDVALQNDRIDNTTIKDLINKSDILKDKTRKDILLEKLIENNKEDLANEIGILQDYYKKLESISPKKLYDMVKDETSPYEIKKKLGIPPSLDSRDFKLYDYAISQDRYDWYQEFASHEENLDMYRVKANVLALNATKILKEMLNKKEDFNDKALWKKATNEARELILESYPNDNVLKQQVIKAAKELNISMVSKVLDKRNPLEPIEGLLHIAAENKSR